MKRLFFILICVSLVSPLLAENLLINPGFETGTTDGWGSRFGASAFEVTTDNPYSGSYCGRGYNRTAEWHGIWSTFNFQPPATELDKEYPVSLYVRTNKETPVSVAVTMQYDPTEGVIYDQIMNAPIGLDWTLMESTYTMLDNDTAFARFYVETLTYTGTPDADPFADIYLDNVVFGTATLGAHDPNVMPPVPNSNSVGTLIDYTSSPDPDFGDYGADVTLGWTSGTDPNEARGLKVNPDIVGHYVWLSPGGENDPNLDVVEFLPQTHDLVDPNLTPTWNELPYSLDDGTFYYWRVDEALQDPNEAAGTAYPVDAVDSEDPNNIIGEVWTFTTISTTPVIGLDPEHTLTDLAGNAQLTAAAGGVFDSVQWFKVGDPDVQLTDAGLYSGVTTETLTISGMASDGSDDAEYYIVAYNAGTPSEPSAGAWVWYPREVNHWTFDAIDVVDSNSFVADDISGLNARLLSDDTGSDIPTLDSNTVFDSGNSLLFDNPKNGGEPNDVDGQYARMDDSWPAYKDVTVSAWVYWKGGAQWQRIVELGNDQQNRMTFLVNPNVGGRANALQFEVVVGGTGQAAYSTADSIPENEWVYVTATLTGNTAKTYVNGEYQEQAGISNDPITFGPTSANYLSYSTYGADTFYGNIDDLRIWNYALTANEVAQEYMAAGLADWVCDQEINTLQYDFNDDCQVDFGDFAIFAARWLDTYRIYPD